MASEDIMISIERMSFGAPDQRLPLPEPVLRRMELLYGTSFSDVRVRLGPEPASLAAKAFAHGSDIYMDRCAVRPGLRPRAGRCWGMNWRTCASRAAAGRWRPRASACAC